MRTHMKNPVLALLAAAGFLIGAAGVSAQAPHEGGAHQHHDHAAQVDVSAAQIDSFVDAFVAVQNINQEYTEKLQQVEDPQAATGLQQEAQEMMMGAITDAGMSIEQYQHIATQAGEDEQLRTQIESALSE